MDEFGSFECLHLVRSVLRGETYAFLDFYDATYSFRHAIKKILGRLILITMVTDFGSLFKTIVKSGTTAEKRLMIDILTTHSFLKRFAQQPWSD